MQHCLRGVVILTTVVSALSLSSPSIADDDPVLTEGFLEEAENIELGRTLFKKHCVSCHGKSSYPGKAPKLKPQKVSAEDVYLRITYGWKKMPAWEEIYSDHERMALTAYIKSPVFSN